MQYRVSGEPQPRSSRLHFRGMVPRASGKSFLAANLQRAGEGGRLKEAEKGLQLQVFSSKCSKRRGSKGHCGHKETCQKDSQPEGNADRLCWKERVGWVQSSTETFTPMCKQLAGGQQLHSRGHSAGARW